MASAETDPVSRTDGESLPDSLLATMSEILWTSSLEGKLSWIHPAAQNLYGYSAAELIADPQLRWQAIDEADRLRVREQWHLLPEKRTLDYECHISDRQQQTHRIHEFVQLDTSSG